MTGEEVDLVTHLQRQQVVRIADGKVFENPTRFVPLAPCEAIDRAQLAMLREFM